ncbi:hypothetical protein Tco_1397470 [Tanacetum coccineum]
MANLEFCDTHNMVAYLNKSEGSEGFNQIFWQTATVSTLDSGEIQITAIIDGKVKIITEASIRRHLKLEDSDGISTLPTTKIFEQLALMGIPTRQESKVPQPRSPTQTLVADETASIGVDVRHEGAATAVSSIDAGQGSDRVVALETDFRQTKKVCGAAYTKLIKKVNKLERAAKSSQSRRRANIVVSDSRRHGQEMEFETEGYTAEDVSTAGAAVTTTSASISTASPQRVSTAEDISTAETLVYIRRSATKDKSKAKMDESEPKQTKTKLQQRQERAGHEATVRLQEQLNEEEKKRITRVHKEASSFNME